MAPEPLRLYVKNAAKAMQAALRELKAG